MWLSLSILCKGSLTSMRMLARLSWSFEHGYGNLYFPRLLGPKSLTLVTLLQPDDSSVANSRNCTRFRSGKVAVNELPKSSSPTPGVKSRVNGSESTRWWQGRWQPDIGHDDLILWSRKQQSVVIARMQHNIYARECTWLECVRVYDTCSHVWTYMTGTCVSRSESSLGLPLVDCDREQS